MWVTVLFVVWGIGWEFDKLRRFSESLISSSLLMNIIKT